VVRVGNRGGDTNLAYLKSAEGWQTGQTYSVL